MIIDKRNLYTITPSIYSSDVFANFISKILPYGPNIKRRQLFWIVCYTHKKIRVTTNVAALKITNWWIKFTVLPCSHNLQMHTHTHITLEWNDKLMSNLHPVGVSPVLFPELQWRRHPVLCPVRVSYGPPLTPHTPIYMHSIIQYNDNTLQVI